MPRSPSCSPAAVAAADATDGGAGDAWLTRFLALPDGYSKGAYAGRRYGATLNRSEDGRRLWLWAEELGGPDRISANLYLLSDGRALLKPCEMPDEAVRAFVLGYRPDG